MTNIYVKYKSHRGQIGKDYYDAVEKGLNEFINNKEQLYKNLPKNESRNIGKHIKSSYLINGIWMKIMQNEGNSGPSDLDNWFLWNKNENDENGLFFHFDIMNNPKHKNCGLAVKYSSEELKE